MNKYLTEFIGTFFLVLTIGMCVIDPGSGAMAPLAIGAVLVALVYAGGPISGAHYNPAVTLALWMRGKCDTSDIPGYVVAQLVAATVASAAVLFLKGAPTVAPGAIETVPALLAEFLFTFGLAWVILSVATLESTAGNAYYGLAIGLTVTGGAYAVGGISGAAFNPAVAGALTAMGLAEVSNIWIYLVAEFAGGAAAALAFKQIAA